MTDTGVRVREHDSATGLTDRIKQALATIAPEDNSGPITWEHQRLSVNLSEFSHG
jgi:hypothetical protein